MAIDRAKCEKNISDYRRTGKNSPTLEIWTDMSLDKGASRTKIFYEMIEKFGGGAEGNCTGKKIVAAIERAIREREPEEIVSFIESLGGRFSRERVKKIKKELSSEKSGEAKIRKEPRVDAETRKETIPQKEKAEKSVSERKENFAEPAGIIDYGLEKIRITLASGTQRRHFYLDNRIAAVEPYTACRRIKGVFYRLRTPDDEGEDCSENSVGIVSVLKPEDLALFAPMIGEWVYWLLVSMGNAGEMELPEKFVMNSDYYVAAETKVFDPAGFFESPEEKLYENLGKRYLIRPRFSYSLVYDLKERKKMRSIGLKEKASESQYIDFATFIRKFTQTQRREFEREVIAFLGISPSDSRFEWY